MDGEGFEDRMMVWICSMEFRYGKTFIAVLFCSHACVAYSTRIVGMRNEMR